MLKKFPAYKQADAKDCGPTCLKIISRYHGKKFDIEQLRRLSETTREGSTLLTLSDAAESLGFRTLGARLSAERLRTAPLPCILHWNTNHYVVLYAITSKPRRGRRKLVYKISDPSYGLVDYTQDEFLKLWIGNNADESTQEGIALLMEPSAAFFRQAVDETPGQPAKRVVFFWAYLKPYKFYIVQLIFGLLAGSLLQLIVPFLTQSVVDVGIKRNDMHFVQLVLLAQVFLFLGRTVLEFVRSWILLHLSARINISLISDFFIKLMNLPIAFFDVRMTGDIMQRINDHHRIERLLTTSSLTVLFSAINVLVMGSILAYYNVLIFAVFAIGSVGYVAWVLMFLKKREELDYKRFSEVSQEQSKVIELINGMQEIKLHNAEKQKRWGWEHVQARLFKVSVKGLALEQVQSLGSGVINELKNILILFLSAKLVMEGQITLGMMMAITSIVGGLNGPVAQLIGFVREVQDARISLRRLAEIHQKPDESKGSRDMQLPVPLNADIVLKDVSFRYPGAEKPVLEQLNMVVPANKITAVVGVSGSGKTTLMKLLLKFYEPSEGWISAGSTDFVDITQKAWRYHVGAVMQEGYVFNDTIAGNIAVGADQLDKQRLQHAASVANIREFIEDCPSQYNTQIGNEGLGLSTGQKQRLLIARAVYKDPKVLFFDEATSALDTNNERQIMTNLNRYFKNKTVLIIAHRLSTVMNADQIVVLEKGHIVETGTHKELVQLQGAYYELVRNQLELGNG